MPWRKSLADYQKRAWKKGILISSLMMAMLLASVHFYLQQSIDQWQMKIVQLKKEKPRKLNFSPKPMPNPFQKNMTLLTALSELTQNQVCFITMKQEKNKITFAGNAKSTNELTAYLKYWHAASLFSQIKIITLHPLQQGQIMQFVFEAEA